MTKYQQGYRVERMCLEELRKEGYFVIRTAGSHSLFDVIAINQTTIRLIQCKKSNKGTIPKGEIEKIKEFKNIPLNCSKELWVWKTREGWIIKQIF